MDEAFRAIPPVASSSFGVYSDDATYQTTPWEDQPANFYESQIEQDRLAAEMRRLMAAWLDDTLDMSSTHDMVTHPAYLQIITNGRRALPFIFRELEREPNHWFTALQAITRENPVPDNARGNIILMRDHWLQWAEREGYG